MNHRLAAPVALALLLLASPVVAGELSWLLGTWDGGNHKETWESVFTSDAGGVILGTYKQATRDGKLTFVELQQFDFRKEPATLILYANGGAPYRLNATRLTRERAEFTGDQAFPRHVALSLERDGRHTLTLTGALKGAPFQERFGFTRRKP